MTVAAHQQDGVVFIALSTVGAGQLMALLDAHIAGDIMTYQGDMFGILEALNGLDLKPAVLYRDETLSAKHGYSVIHTQLLETGGPYAV